MTQKWSLLGLKLLILLSVFRSWQKVYLDEPHCTEVRFENRERRYGAFLDGWIVILDRKFSFFTRFLHFREIAGPLKNFWVSNKTLQKWKIASSPSWKCDVLAKKHFSRHLLAGCRHFQPSEIFLRNHLSGGELCQSMLLWQKIHRTWWEMEDEQGFESLDRFLSTVRIKKSNFLLWRTRWGYNGPEKFLKAFPEVLSNVRMFFPAVLHFGE